MALIATDASGRRVALPDATNYWILETPDGTSYAVERDGETWSVWHLVYDEQAQDWLFTDTHWTIAAVCRMCGIDALAG
jgi:hypothetical protein